MAHTRSFRTRILAREDVVRDTRVPIGRLLQRDPGGIAAVLIARVVHERAGGRLCPPCSHAIFRVFVSFRFRLSGACLGK